MSLILTQRNHSPIDVDASQELCDIDSANPCVFQELGDSMSESSLFSSTPEIPEDTFCVLFEISAKYRSLEAAPALVFASSRVFRLSCETPATEKHDIVLSTSSVVDSIQTEWREEYLESDLIGSALIT